jgi:hypothetical protein
MDKAANQWRIFRHHPSKSRRKIVAVALICCYD